MNFPSIVRLLITPLALGLYGSTFVHAAAVGVILYLLLAVPQLWEFEVRRGEAVVLQAQLAAVAAAQPEPMQIVKISAEPMPFEPPPAPAIDHTPIRDTLEPIPAAIPLARTGEYEPTEAPPQQRPPESAAVTLPETQVLPRELTPETPPPTEVAPPTLDRQVAELVRVMDSKVTVQAAAPAVAGAQVDVLPRKLPNNPEPEYPREALLAGRQGRVLLQVQISTTGRAAKIEVAISSGTSSLDASAIRAVRDWKFSPALRNGVAVVQEVLMVPVNFSIR